MNQRKINAEKLMDLANMAYAGLVIGQVLNEQFKFYYATLGLLLFVGLYIAANVLLKGGD